MSSGTRQLSYTLLLLILTGILGYFIGYHQHHPAPALSLFPRVVEHFTGHRVIAFQPTDPTDSLILHAISQAASETCHELNQHDSPTHGLRRINEASSFFENALLKHLNSQPGLLCRIPQNHAGRAQRSGYPDLHLTHLASGKHYYLDPKLYELSSEHSSLRTFYYTPHSQKGKVQHDAVHLLLGISHDGNDGDWTFKGWKLIDLHTLPLRLKSEYNASNRELYHENLILASGIGTSHEKSK